LAEIKEKNISGKTCRTKRNILLCWQNEKDVHENRQQLYIKGVQFHYVKTMQQVLELALV